MNKFLIGMHGKYDFDKFSRDYRKDFYGLEVCLFSDNDIVNLKKQSEKFKYKYGIHFPLRKSKLCIGRDAQFLSLSDHERYQSFNRINEELQYIKDKRLNPEYILFHFPKPAIIESDFDLNRWRFSKRNEYIYENEYSFELFKKYSKELFKWLTEKSEQYDFIPVLELDALNKYILDYELIDKLLEKYSRIKICLDIGRLHIQDMINDKFNAYSLVSRFAKYTYLVHLWNAIPGNNRYYHYPPLKELKVSDGFADIEKYLKLIKNQNSDFKILFEHRSEVISDNELEECYMYVKNILNP